MNVSLKHEKSPEADECGAEAPKGINTNTRGCITVRILGNQGQHPRISKHVPQFLFLRRGTWNFRGITLLRILGAVQDVDKINLFL